MIRYTWAALAALGLAALWLSPGAAQGQKQGWGTIKGRIVWGGDKLPPKEQVKVTVDKAHCLGDGPLFDNLFEVSPKTKGLKNVFVALKQPPDQATKPLPINPKLLKMKGLAVPIDQPRCLFMPRAVAIWEEQKLLAKNSSPVVHNIRLVGDEDFGNETRSIVIPAGNKITLKNLKAQPLPLLVQCNIHPWMSGRLAVYNHPYFAVTDADGNFEIKLAPAGTYRLTAYHEGIGWRGGAKGKTGQEITIQPGQTVDVGELKMGK